MLILTRKVGESIAIGDDITVKVLGIQGRQVRLGVVAPTHIPVHREEVYRRILEENKKASLSDEDDLSTSSRLLRNMKDKEEEEDSDKTSE